MGWRETRTTINKQNKHKGMKVSLEFEFAFVWSLMGMGRQGAGDASSPFMSLHLHKCTQMLILSEDNCSLSKDCNLNKT